MTKYTYDRHIGNYLRNRAEVGDEVAVSFDNGEYYNREVMDVYEDSAHDREVVIGNLDGVHAVLVVDTNDDAESRDEEWDVWGYRLTSRPEHPDERIGTIEALAHLDRTELPDVTVSEVADEHDVDPQEVTPHEGVEELREMKEEIDFLMSKMEQVAEDNMTLAQYEKALESYAVRRGGRLAIDDW